LIFIINRSIITQDKNSEDFLMKRISYSIQGGICLITIKGEMTFFFIEELNSFIKEEATKNNCCQFIFDLSETTWIDSIGLGLIASAVKIALINDSKAAIINPRENIISLLRISSLIDLVNIFKTKEEALKSFSKKGK
jgi:anti-sigma B factor antagonist